MRRRPTIAAVVIAAAGAGAAGPLSEAPATRAAGPIAASTGPLRVIPSCAALASKRVVYRAPSGQVVVRRASVRGDRGGSHDWACRADATTASAWPLGGSFSTSFPVDETVDTFTSAGPWLVDVASSRAGWPCPPQRRGGHCTRYHHEIELVDLAGTGSGSSAPCGAGVQLHLSETRAGNGDRVAAVAWTQSAGHGQVRLTAITLRDFARHPGRSSFAINPSVTGRIDPRSVRVRGLRVSFLQDGHRRTLTLGA